MITKFVFVFVFVFVFGTGQGTKMDEFSEVPNGLCPPPSFLENYVAIFFMMDMVAYMQGGMRAR